MANERLIVAGPDGKLRDDDLPSYLTPDALQDTIAAIVNSVLQTAEFGQNQVTDLEAVLDAKMTKGYADLPAGVTITVNKKADGTWPVRPTTRTDITVHWKGADPSPAIVSSGTGGMYATDVREVTV